MLSITSTFIGLFFDSSDSPSCSRSAVVREGCVDQAEHRCAECRNER